MTINDLKQKLKTLTSKWHYLKTEADAKFITDEDLNSFVNYVDDKEDKSNKVTSLSIYSTNTEYPSAKAVYDTLNGYNSSLSDTYQTKKVGSGKTYENKNVVTNSSGNITVENKPTIPSKTSDLTNDSNFLTSHQDISGKEDTSNKSSSIASDTGSTTKYPTVKAVEDYAQPIGNYLTSHQSLTDYIQKSQTNGLVKNDGSIDATSYSTFSGSYNDLNNKPSIPSDVSDLTDTNNVIPSDVSDLTDGSNTQFTPKTHTHSSSDVTGLTANLNVCTDSNGNLSTEYRNNHNHGSIGASGTINSDIASTNVNKIIVTNSSNQIKTISSLPSSKISNLDTLTATVNYTDNTSETIEFYIVPSQN